MKVKIGDQDYRIEFAHDPAALTVSAADARRPATTCRIVKPGPDGERLIVAVGYAYRSPLDIFSKEKGRKVSLARAVKEFPKERRKLFWDAYRSRGPVTYPREDPRNSALIAAHEAEYWNGIIGTPGTDAIRIGAVGAASNICAAILQGQTPEQFKAQLAERDRERFRSEATTP